MGLGHGPWRGYECVEEYACAPVVDLEGVGDAIEWAG